MSAISNLRKELATFAPDAYLADDGRLFLTGWHYTSSHHYQQIKKEGLQPYFIKKEGPMTDLYFPDGVMGIWLWQNDLKGEEHAGSIIWQLHTKGYGTIVKLRVLYDVETLLTFFDKEYQNSDGTVGAKRDVSICHDGVMGEWKWHSGTKSVIVTAAIPPKDIKLVQKYDIVRRLK
jgi:hypothetical protein